MTNTAHTQGLGPGEIHIWTLDTSRLPASPVLSGAEEERAGKRLGEAYREFVATHDGLRRILAGYLGVRPEDLSLSSEAAQRPTLDGSEIEIGLSHRAGRALVALAREPVGVDLERADAFPDEEINDVAEFILAEGDRKSLLELPTEARPRALALSFVRKEAAMKARGLGLGDVSLRDADATIDEATQRSSLSIYDLDVGDEFVAAVATTKAVSRIVVRRSPQEIWA